MRFLYWCVGVLQILTGFMLAWSIAPAWRWVWIVAAVFWLFTGASLAVLGTARLVSRKVGAGVGWRAARRGDIPPQPKKEDE
jgi:hypothetical protein